jgi:hypothetical protein
LCRRARTVIELPLRVNPSLAAVLLLASSLLHTACGTSKSAEEKPAKAPQPGLFTVSQQQLGRLRIVPPQKTVWSTNVQTGTVDWDSDHTTQAITQMGGPISLRIFDKNQGEKLRTQPDLGRNEKLCDAALAQVFSDVDPACAMLNSNLTLLRPYKADYLHRALKVRDTVAFTCQSGEASLLDFLNAQSDYRSIELNYLNLIGSYLTATSQLNLVMGREVIL